MLRRVLGGRRIARLSILVEVQDRMKPDGVLCLESLRMECGVRLCLGYDGTNGAP
jgi:hypothetical protein